MGGTGEVGRRARHRGVSLLEILMVLAIISVVLYALMTLMGSGRRMEDSFGAHLGLQLDAQRSLTQMIQSLQEGITVVLPQPGNTLPHAVVRDKLNRLVLFSLVPAATPGEYQLRRDIASPGGVETTTLLTGVRRVTFTSLSDAALLLHVILGSGEHRYAFHTEVRLRNRDAAEPE